MFLFSIGLIYSTAQASRDYTWEASLTYKEKEVRLYFHFPAEKFEVVKRIMNFIKKDFGKIHRFFDYIPRSDVHFKFSKGERTANGAAQVFPYNIVHLFDFPPMGDDTLMSSQDWMRILVIHEYVHIVTLEMTTGAIDFFRTFLGSTVKFNQFVPLWLSEGVAVWIESVLTGQGRLNNPYIANKVKSLLKNEEFCNDLSCLDEPKYFPYRQFPYWAGSLFLDYMEKKQKGTIACLFKENSNNVFLMLHDTFYACTRKDANEQFEDFLTWIKSKNNKTCHFVDENSCQEKLRRQVDWFKGTVELPNQRIYIEKSGDKGISTEYGAEKIVFKNKRGKGKKVIIDGPIENLYEQDGKVFLSTFTSKKGKLDREFFYLTEEGKRKKIDYDLCSFKNQSADYILYSEGEKKYYCMKYYESRWFIYYKVKKKIYYKKFDVLKNIVNPSLKQDTDGLSLVYFTRPKQFKDRRLQKFKLDMFDTWPTEKKAKKVSEKKNKKWENKAVDYGAQKYRSWKYLKPSFLFLEYTSSGNIDAIGASTSLSDPLGYQGLTPVLYYNFGLESDRSPYSGGASYFYKWGRYTFSAGYFKTISQNSFLEDSISESNYLQVSRPFSLSGLSISANLGYSEFDENETWYSRKLRKYTSSISLSHRVRSLKSFYRSTVFQADLSYDQNYSADHYWHLETKLSQFFRLGEDFQMAWTGAYGRLFHNDETLAQGDIDGGGVVSSLSSEYFFSSYLIPYGDIFGDNIGMFQLDFDHIINRPYTGDGLFPIYFKNLLLTYGVEYLDSDVLITDDTTTTSIRRDFKNNASVFSGYIGAALDTKLIYILPILWEVVYSVPLNRSDLDAQLSFILKAGYRY